MGNSQSKGTTLEGPGHSSSTPFLEHNKDRKTGNFVLQTGHSNLISGSKHAVKRDLPVLSSGRAQLRKVLKSDPDNVKGLPLTLHHSKKRATPFDERGFDFRSGKRKRTGLGGMHGSSISKVAQGRPMGSRFEGNIRGGGGSPTEEDVPGDGPGGSSEGNPGVDSVNEDEFTKRYEAFTTYVDNMPEMENFTEAHIAQVEHLFDHAMNASRYADSYHFDDFFGPSNEFEKSNEWLDYLKSGKWIHGDPKFSDEICARNGHALVWGYLHKGKRPEAHKPDTSQRKDTTESKAAGMTKRAAPRTSGGNLEPKSSLSDDPRADGQDLRGLSDDDIARYITSGRVAKDFKSKDNPDTFFDDMDLEDYDSDFDFNSDVEYDFDSEYDNDIDNDINNESNSDNDNDNDSEGASGLRGGDLILSDSDLLLRLRRGSHEITEPGSLAGSAGVRYDEIPESEFRPGLRGGGMEEPETDSASFEWYYPDDDIRELCDALKLTVHAFVNGRPSRKRALALREVSEAVVEHGFDEAAKNYFQGPTEEAQPSLVAKVDAFVEDPVYVDITTLSIVHEPVEEKYRAALRAAMALKAAVPLLFVRVDEMSAEMRIAHEIRRYKALKHYEEVMCLVAKFNREKGTRPQGERETMYHRQILDSSYLIRDYTRALQDLERLEKVADTLEPWPPKSFGRHSAPDQYERGLFAPDDVDLDYCLYQISEEYSAVRENYERLYAEWEANEDIAGDVAVDMTANSMACHRTMKILRDIRRSLFLVAENGDGRKTASKRAASEMEEVSYIEEVAEIEKEAEVEEEKGMPQAPPEPKRRRLAMDQLYRPATLPGQRPLPDPVRIIAFPGSRRPPSPPAPSTLQGPQTGQTATKDKQVRFKDPAKAEQATESVAEEDKIRAQPQMEQIMHMLSIVTTTRLLRDLEQKPGSQPPGAPPAQHHRPTPVRRPGNSYDL